MTFVWRVFPQPTVTLAIVALWMTLASSSSIGNLLIAALLGFLIPLATQSFWPDRPQVARPFLGIALFGRVVADIIIANWEVARLVLGPVDRIAPGFVDIPIDIEQPFVATLLASIVSLTPGTVSVDIDLAQKVLHVHALKLTDRGDLIDNVKRRYEAPLKEVFGC